MQPCAPFWVFSGCFELSPPVSMVHFMLTSFECIQQLSPEEREKSWLCFWIFETTRSCGDEPRALVVRFLHKPQVEHQRSRVYKATCLSALCPVFVQHG